MPILTIQRRMAEQGRIRLGHKVPVGNQGKSRPGKLEEFRFTSPNERLIRDIAQLYGGQPRAWDNAGKHEFEVLTDARSIPVIVVKGGFSQWMETWSGGGCTHRCDGVTNVLTDTPCDPADPKHQQAKPTTRLSVMLRDVETLGVWRLESHGWNAAAELPSMAELAMHVGDYVPATLNLVERTKVADGQTSRFVVPVLDLAVSKQRLVAIMDAQSNGAPAISAPERAAIEAPRPDYLAELETARSTDDCSALWRQAGSAGHLTDDLKAAITAKAQSFETPGPASEESPSTAADADPGPDADAVWIQVVTAAGKLGMTDAELRAALDSEYDVTAESADAETLQAFLHTLTTGEAVRA